MTLAVVIVGAIWLLGVALGVAALQKMRKAAWFSLLLALGSIGIGAAGFWRPFPLWPPIFWHNIDLSWFFLLPMVLGGTACVLTLRARSRTSEKKSPAASEPAPAEKLLK